MAFDTHANLLKVTVTVAPSPATSGTTVSISNTDRTALIAVLTAPFNMVAQPSNGANETNCEIIRVTAIGAADSGGTGNTQLTITRQAETGGINRSIGIGDVLTNNPTVKTFTDIENNINGFIYNETPTGTINGSNTSFTLANTPISGSLQLYRDGQLLNGGGNDYTLSGTTITFTTAPATGSVLLAYYSKAATGSGVNAATVNGYSANATPTASNIPVLNGVAQLPGTAIGIPDGEILNGQLVTSVSTNNLTVALKGMNGSNPSTSNPVYIRLGNTIYTVTAALSVTTNAGTNWFNSGASETATHEIDYFVYLGYNATDGVTIGFARHSYMRTYGDFSITSTAETFGAISTITHAASTDVYAVVGRFNAILSAGAGYTWSIPATSIIINKPIFETRWLTYTPTYSASGSMTYTSVTTNLAIYKLNNNYCFLVVSSTGTTGGTAAGELRCTTPIARNNTANYPYAGAASVTDGTSGISGICNWQGTSTQLLAFQRYDGGTFTLAVGREAKGTIFYAVGAAAAA